MAEAPTIGRGPRAGRGRGDAPLPEHVTVPLLALITQRSLDADYEHVAVRRRASGQPVSSRPVPRRTAGLVLLVFGLLVTIAAVQTRRDAPEADASRESLIQQADLRRQGVSELQQQISREEAAVLSLQGKLGSLSSDVTATRARVQRLQAPTGFGAVSGPGVQITVNSAPGSAGTQLVRDSDLNLLTDALWAAGAEAISVNGQRLTVLSAFRNVGIGILVNSEPVNPPYVFDVVGDPDTLPADLLSSSVGEKWYALRAALGFRFDVQNGGTMSLPAADEPRLRSAKMGPSHGNGRTKMGESAP